jgi:hypothetical protein
MKRYTSLGDYWVILLANFGAFASILTYHYTFNEHLDDQGLVGVAFLGIIAIFYIAYSFYLKEKYRRNARYKVVFENINIGTKKLNACYRDLQIEIKPNEIYAILQDICDSISDAFEKIYNQRFSVCIKLIGEQGGMATVETILRDKRSKRPINESGVMHLISDNSDFQFIFDSDMKKKHPYSDCNFIVMNNLPQQEPYYNSRIKGQWPPRKFLLGNRLIRKWLWPLKDQYNSSIVMGILPLVPDPDCSLNGFLCIDSLKINVFNDFPDVDILSGICDRIYKLIAILYDNVKDENNDGK